MSERMAIRQHRTTKTKRAGRIQSADRTTPKIGGSLLGWTRLHLQMQSQSSKGTNRTSTLPLLNPFLFSSFAHLSEDDVLAVQPGGHDGAQEELRTEVRRSEDKVYGDCLERVYRAIFSDRQSISFCGTGRISGHHNRRQIFNVFRSPHKIA